jgi:UDPglucose 6-dehydrogenase
MEQKIGIIGLGFLGGSVDHYFTEKGLTTYRFDKKGIGSEDEVNKADIVFICVNTPFNEEQKNIDLSYVRSAIEALTGKKIIVLRSTIPAGTTDSFQREFSQHRFLFNPEFLRAATAYEDFIKPTRQVVGFTKQSEGDASMIMSLLPEAPVQFKKIIPARAAELLKYASNTILATKVALGNKIFDFSHVLDIDYEEIKILLGADPRIGSYGLNIFYEGFRGYNGTCFPKDVRTFIALGEKLGVDVKWLKIMDDENIALLKFQGKAPDYGYPQKG